MSRREPCGSSSRLMGVPGRMTNEPSDGHFALDGGVRDVALQHEVLVRVVEKAVRRTCERDLRHVEGLACELQLYLLHEVVVDVAVAARPDEVAQLQTRLLRDHHRQQRVGRDVEGHPEEHIRTALIQLAGQLPVHNAELEERVARRERHVRNLRRVPGRDHQSTRVRVSLDLLDHFRNLVDGTPVCALPASPLLAIDGAEVAVLVGPLVPNLYALGME